jgi:ribosome biogenesis GTPase
VHRLEEIGWTSEWAKAMTALDPGDVFAPARVVEERRGSYRLLWQGGELWAEVSGRMRYVAFGPEDLPAVGDWVTVAPRVEEARGTIHHVLPRRTCLVRKAPDRPARAQLLAANVDTVFAMCSANLDFSPRRLERILTLAREGGARSVVVLSKLDVAEALESKLELARVAAPDVALLALSARTGEGVDALAPYLGAGSSVVLLGSSGVGKSTLVNRLLGEERLATQEVRDADDKGRHTTTHRELVPLPTGGVLIDTPGLREVGLWEDEGAVDAAFPEIEALLGQCRFTDCAHEGEPGCAVEASLDQGEIDPGRYQSYLRLKRETAHLRVKRDAHARHEQRKDRKKFSKMIRRRPDKRRPAG